MCIFLALLVALGMFGIHAVVPDLLKKGIQGLIGYGFWMVAFVLLWAAGLLLFRRDRRQTLRLWCLGLLPVVGGALLHILLWPGTYPIDFYLVGRLWTDGVQSMGGGVVSGFLAVVTVKGISRLAAGLVFALLFVILLALAAHVTRGQVSGAVSRARDHHAQRAARREKYAEYDDDDEYEDEYDDYDDEDWDEDPDPAPYAAREARRPAPRPAVSLWPFPRRKRAADVPLDDPEKLQAKRDEEKAQRRSHRAQSKPSAPSLRPDEGEMLPADTLFHRETGAAAQQEPELASADDFQPAIPLHFQLRPQATIDRCSIDQDIVLVEDCMYLEGLSLQITPLADYLRTNGYHCKDDSIYSYKVLDERGHRVCNYLQSFASYTNEIPDPLYVVAYKEDQEVNRICLRRKGNIWKIEE